MCCFFHSTHAKGTNRFSNRLQPSAYRDDDSIYFSPFGVPWCGARARVETYITVKKNLLHGSNAPSGADGLFLKPYKVHPLWHKVSTIQHLHSVFTTVGIPKRARDSGSRVWKFWAAIISLGTHKTRLKIYRAHSSTKTPALWCFYSSVWGCWIWWCGTAKQIEEINQVQFKLTTLAHFALCVLTFLARISLLAQMKVFLWHSREL